MSFDHMTCLKTNDQISFSNPFSSFRQFILLKLFFKYCFWQGATLLWYLIHQKLTEWKLAFFRHLISLCWKWFEIQLTKNKFTKNLTSLANLTEQTSFSYPKPVRLLDIPRPAGPQTHFSPRSNCYKINFGLEQKKWSIRNCFLSINFLSIDPALCIDT